MRSGPEVVPGDRSHGRYQSERADDEALLVGDQKSAGFAELRADPMDPFGRLPLHVPEDFVDQFKYEWKDGIWRMRRVSGVHGNGLYARGVPMTTEAMR